MSLDLQSYLVQLKNAHGNITSGWVPVHLRDESVANCCTMWDMASKGSITAGVKNIQYFHDPGALFDPQRDVMDKGLFKNVCITTTACYRFQLPGYRQLGKQSRCFTDRMIMSCSGPIPAQKARTNSVPGAIFSHLMNFYYFHRFSWEKYTKMIGHMPWLYQ